MRAIRWPPILDYMSDDLDSESPHPQRHHSRRVSDDERRRLLELELVKIRGDVSVARLEARAAEIEMILENLRRKTTDRVDPAHPPRESPRRFTSWSEVRSAQANATRPATTNEITNATTTAIANETTNAATTAITNDSKAAPDCVTAGDSDSDPVHLVDHPAVRTDGGSSKVRRPKFLDGEQEASRELTPAFDRVREGETKTRRRRPAAWMISAVTHVVVLIVLASIGFSTHIPKDQVALSATTSSSDSEPIETLEIESVESVPETPLSEPIASDEEYDLSPIGELAVADFSPDAYDTTPAAMAEALSIPSTAASAMSMKSVSNEKMEFCGVEGGGNHFVYLVDSSGSMGDGFESARSALIASINLLTPEQRFYVVFFDAKTDYMRLRPVDEDEPTSVFATPENKAALKRWAMRITADRGQAPYDPLRFALKLRPDVIFLLSDGEFPQGIEDLLKTENNVSNLFGESKPISIVHTIAYHSEEGESRMRRIAKQNHGQYRYVPRP